MVNTCTGKPALAEGYAPRTINHCLSAVYGFYAFHGHYGRGPVTVPPPRKTPTRISPRLAPFKTAIDDMLRSDVDTPKKQRHTARRVLARLVDEHGATDLSYSTVRDYVAKRRPEIVAEAGRSLEAGCVPQTHPPAGEAEGDFHDLWVILRGIKTKTALFTMRLSFSGRAAHRAFLTQGQEAFLEGHVYAFERLGGVPIDKIRYDKPQQRGVAGAVRSPA